MNASTDEWGTTDFLARYTTHSSRHSSPDKTTDQEGLLGSPVFGLLNNSSEKQFCRRDNVDQCLAYLNQEVKVLGFQPLYSSSINQDSSNSFDIVRLINCTYELLQLQQQNHKVRTSLEERNLRSGCDNEYLVQSQKRLKAQVESLEREISRTNERERQLQNKVTKLKEQLKNEKDEVKKVRSNFQQLQNQISHENKKKEREMVKLKDRVHQMLTDKNQEKKIGMELLNSLQRADGKRAMWKTGNRSEEEMYRLLVTNYEARQKELIKENNDLRNSLLDMQAELVSALNQQQSGYDSDSEGCISDDPCSGLSVRSLPAGHFNMPYEMVREGIEKSLRDKWRVLKTRLEQANKGSSSSSPEDSQEKIELKEEVEKLNNQLENYRHILQQQEALIESMQEKENDGTTGIPDSSFLSDSRMCEEWERLKDEKLMFNEQKRTFDEERKNFTEAASKLGYERKKFEDERGHFIKQQLLATPAQRKISPSYKKIRSPDGSSTPRLQISTPTFSPAPRLKADGKTVNIPRDGPVLSPSTTDLYKALSLRTDDMDTTDETPKLPNKAESMTRSSPDVTHFRSRRINEHAQNVKRALQLKQGSSPGHE